MKLSPLLDGVRVIKLFQTMFGRMVVTHDVEVNGLQYDSRKVSRGDCFIAIRGSGSDGHAFLQDAASRGASVIVVEDDAAIPDSLCMHLGVIKIVVGDSRKALALMSANYYGHPSRKLTMIGVTGTNGKTTTSHLIRSLLSAAGQETGLIGTVHYQFGKKTIPASHTTPESLELNRLLVQMVDEGCTSVCMEVSSHALDQSRVHGIDFDAGVFTNLTQDHLDYHQTMEEYFLAKKKLFDSLPSDAWTIANRDDEAGKTILAASGGRTLSYGFDAQSDVRAANADFSMNGTQVSIEYKGAATEIRSPLVGRFNVYNILASFAVGAALELSAEDIRKGIEQTVFVKGRFEKILSSAGWTVIVDYAHTPDALEKCLRTIHEVLPKQGRGKILVVFGAGGDRDSTKRPLMGSIAAELADICMVTSDNPRTEDPDRIIADILQGIRQREGVFVEPDRRKAILRALSLARYGDVVLIAGKGHEEYQILGNEKIHFSDREIVEEFLQQQ
ncbi:MAG: UDP-N-acetylmuramoyl-L-alanyl-D-glutamate--2,6-diaminopimelate ligase [Bacteroidota bacterium]